MRKSQTTWQKFAGTPWTEHDPPRVAAAATLMLSAWRQVRAADQHKEGMLFPVAKHRAGAQRHEVVCWQNVEG